MLLLHHHQVHHCTVVLTAAVVMAVNAAGLPTWICVSTGPLQNKICADSLTA
jgi:hypothetical protein